MRTMTIVVMSLVWDLDIVYGALYCNTCLFCSFFFLHLALIYFGVFVIFHLCEKRIQALQTYTLFFFSLSSALHTKYNHLSYIVSFKLSYLFCLLTGLSCCEFFSSVFQVWSCNKCKYNLLLLKLSVFIWSLMLIYFVFGFCSINLV